MAVAARLLLALLDLFFCAAAAATAPVAVAVASTTPTAVEQCDAG